MRKTLILLAASTALTAAIGLPAWSAIHAPADGNPQSFATFFEDAVPALPLILACNDDDDDDDHSSHKTSRSGHDDDDEDDDDDCDDGCQGGATKPAPAGTVAPPQNGLFGSGTAPKVQVN